MDPNTFDFAEFPVLAFLLAVLANIVIGFVWYAQWSPTGKIWIRETKMDTTRKVPAKEMTVTMGLMVMGALFMMFVFTHTNVVYEDAFRNTASGGTAGYDLQLKDTLTGAFLTWLGFIVPIHFNGVAFDRKPWSLFWVNTGYYLVSLMVAGAFIAVL